MSLSRTQLTRIASGKEKWAIVVTAGAVFASDRTSDSRLSRNAMNESTSSCCRSELAEGRDIGVVLWVLGWVVVGVGYTE